MTTVANDAPPPDTDGAVAVAPSGRRRFGTAWLAAAIVVGLLLGLLAGLLVPSLRTPGDDAPEAGFARDMSLHHAQAVEMAMITYAKAVDPRTRTIAYDIVMAQQNQIGTMQRWLQEWRLSPTGSQPRMAWMTGGAELVQNGLMPGMATTEEIDALRAATGENVDKMFITLMTKHHLGGLHMVDGILAETHRPEVTALATAMKTGQQNEITAMHQIEVDLDK